MSSPARSTFMHQFVRELARQHARFLPADDPNPHTELLKKVREDLAHRARAIRLSDAEFERRFATRIVPAFRDVAQSVLAEG